MIDLSLPPYNVKPDFTGSYSGATDWTSAFKDAIAAAALSTGSTTDAGGTVGDTLVVPKGACLISQKLTLPYGVSIQGSGDCASALVMNQVFDPASNFIELGDPTTQLSAFGGRLKNLTLYAAPYIQAQAPAAMVYTNNNQDTSPMLDGLRIYGFNRICVKGEKGYGGATVINMRQLTMVTSGPGLPCMVMNYGESTQVVLEFIEPAAGMANGVPIPGTIGIAALGGLFNIKQVHGEQIESTIFFNLSTAECRGHTEWVTGGPGTRDIIVVANNAAQKNRITLQDIYRNGASRHIVVNGQSGASPIDTEIVDRIKL